MKKLPKFSIVIAAYNEEKHIEYLLKSIMKLNYPKNKLEVIVIDDGSTDRTPEIIARYPIKIIKVHHKGVGVARNIGWKVSTGEIISFIDADLILNKNYIKEMMKTFRDKKVVASSYLRLIRNKKSLIARLLYLRGILGVNELPYTIATSIRRKVLEELNGINPDYGYYDDWELTMRILKKGYKIIWSPKAIVWHNEPENLDELYRQCKWAGKSMVFSFRGYKIEAIRRMLFPLLCAPLPIYSVFLFFPFPLWVLGVFGLILFLLVELKRLIKMFLITKQKESFLTPFFDFISMLFVLWGILIGFKNVFTKTIQHGA